MSKPIPAPDPDGYGIAALRARERGSMMRLLNGNQIGWLRGLLLVRGTHRWNAWVRDVTAWLG
jgi:hypothetical protein